jgi:hypothetical protein
MGRTNAKPRSARGSAIALAVVAVVLALAAGVFWVAAPRHEAAAGARTSTAGGPSSPAVGGTSGGALQPSDAPLTVTLPQDLSWTAVAGIPLPVSASVGPHQLGQTARGFSHDPLGAVFAAAHIVIRTNPQVGADVFGPTIRDQVIGPDAATLQQQVSSAYDDLRSRYQVPYGQPAGVLYATLRGFRLEQYTPGDAWLRLLTEGPGPGGQATLASTLLQTHWTGSDWVLVAPPGGDFSAVMAPVSTTDSYTLFPRSTP